MYAMMQCNKSENLAHILGYQFWAVTITHGASLPIPVKKLQNTVSPISFLWGDVSRDK